MKNAKILMLVLSICAGFALRGQNLQLHYDVRKAIDPGTNAKDYISLTFEYFKELDSLGSFLFKMQTDLNGDHGNVGQTFIQISQNLKFWDKPIYLALNYSGGLGIAPSSFGYYIPNAYAIGAAHPFQWKGAWLSINLQYRYTAFERVSHDAQFTFYFGRGFFDYRLFVGGSIVAWTENRDQGIEYTADLKGKHIKFFGDPQIWYKINDGLSIGSRVNLLYNLVGEKESLKIYPTLGMQYKF